jgi:hypothetical protein
MGVKSRGMVYHVLRRQGKITRARHPLKVFASLWAKGSGAMNQYGRWVGSSRRPNNIELL